MNTDSTLKAQKTSGSLDTCSNSQRKDHDQHWAIRRFYYLLSDELCILAVNPAILGGIPKNGQRGRYLRQPLFLRLSQRLSWVFGVTTQWCWLGHEYERILQKPTDTQVVLWRYFGMKRYSASSYRVSFYLAFSLTNIRKVDDWIDSWRFKAGDYRVPRFVHCFLRLKECWHHRV